MQVHLPEDIINEILLRIPAEVLTSFKAVCKLWFDIITNSQFVDKHLSHHQWHSHYVLVYKSGKGSLKGGYEFININDMEDTMYQLHHHQIESILKDDISFKYSSDGLLLFQSGINSNQLYVCNPVTRKFSILPPHTTEGFEKINLPLHFRKCFLVIFGSISWSLFRDGSIGQFMVVGITENQSPNKCFVYTTTSTDWTVFEILEQIQYSYLSSTILLNKELYWYSKIRPQILQPHLRSTIYWLHVAEEKIKATQVPFQEARKNIIIELKGVLCLTDHPFDKNQLDIWTLQNREKGIWSKDYSISLPLNVDFKYWHGPFRVYHSNQTSIVLADENLVFTYDLKNNYWKKFAFPVKIGGKEILFECFHVNSLVEFKNENYSIEFIWKLIFLKFLPGFINLPKYGSVSFSPSLSAWYET